MNNTRPVVLSGAKGLAYVGSPFEIHQMLRSAQHDRMATLAVNGTVY